MSIQETPITTEPASDLTPGSIGVPVGDVDTEPLLQFDATVPRYLVHRAAVAEVFITDSAVIGENTFVVAAQLPRGHYIGEHASVYDFMLLVEVLRQAGIVVTHRYFDVSTEMTFIFRSFGLRVGDISHTCIGSGPAEVVISISVDPERNRAGRLQGLKFNGEACIDGQPAFDAGARLFILRKGSYQALRSHGRDARLQCARPVTARFARALPRTVGRRDPRNVVITEPTLLEDGQVSASLVVDVSHPYMFDHPLDHVPGNLVLEACRQVSVAAVAQRHGLATDSLIVVGITGDFGEFAELDLITRVTAEVGELSFDDRLQTSVAPVTLELTQADATVASAKVEVAGWS